MKAQLKTGFCLVSICLALCLSAFNARAFALLGPVQPWMQTTNGVIQPGDIGGPMCISNEYRWNVPVLTYGFDKSFLDYFGSNGVAAVESAIQVLNDLPPASQLVPTDYPLDSEVINYAAQSQNLYDLKSRTLSLLLEQMGLSKPTRYIFVTREWNPVQIVQRNFDPQTLDASPYVNDSLYTYSISSQNGQNFTDIIPVDPFNNNLTVADSQLNEGEFYVGLTYDDVGGLAYLLSTNNVNYETLLSDVVGVGINANSFMNGAWRPGVDKITFIPQPVDSQSGAFLPTTNYFTDNYITNGVLQQQQMARVISQPDFLFSAGDVTSSVPAILLFTRTGTTNWLNNALANGNTNGAGPGVIQPQVQIVFNKLGQQFETDGNNSIEWNFPWASFDGSPNAPIIYPIPQTGTNLMTVRMWLDIGTYPNWLSRSFVWQPASTTGTQFAMQTSTNLINWTTLFTVTNNGSVCTYYNINPASQSRFYRVVPQ